MKSIETVDLNTRDGSVCNNNCVFCGGGYDKPKDSYLHPAPAETERIKRRLQLKRKKSAEVIFTVEGGGEPTIRGDLLELLSYAHKLGYKSILLQTNGRMFCYPGFTKKFIGTGRNIVQIALHASDAELHDRITQVRGSFEQTVQGIKNLLVYRDKIDIHITVLIHKMNYASLPATARFISRRFKGIRGVEFLPVDLTGNQYTDMKKLSVRLANIKPYLEKALEILDKNGFNSMIHFIPFCIINKKYWKNICVREIRHGLTTWKSSYLNTYCSITESCKSCIMEEKCCGTWNSYISTIGTNEFKPIKSI